MPDIDTLMQEWSPEFEELLGKVSGKVAGAEQVGPQPDSVSPFSY